MDKKEKKYDRLPKWAQLEIKALKEENKDLKEILNSINKSSEGEIVITKGISPISVSFSKNYSVDFKLPSGVIRVHIDNNKLLVMHTGTNELLVIPRATNAILIDQRRPY